MENKRLRWACRRGMLELDEILMPFHDQYFQTLSKADQKTFEELLSVQDPELYHWFIGTETPESQEFVELIKLIKSKIAYGL